MLALSRLPTILSRLIAGAKQGAPGTMQINPNIRKHAMHCSFAVPKQIYQPVHAHSMPAGRASCLALRHAAHESRQANCSMSGAPLQLASQEDQQRSPCRRQAWRHAAWGEHRKGRDAGQVGCSVSSSSAAFSSSAGGDSPSSSRAPSGLLKFVQDQFLPLALLVGMTIGYLSPGPGLSAADAGLQSLTTTGIFIISGLGLKRGEAMKALSSWGAILFGFASILFITPLAALAVQRLPLGSPELTMGLAVFCCMPTTLSSGVSLTQAVGGNAALALLLTVGTNLAGIFTMPFMLCWLLDTGSSSVALSPGPLLQSLVKTILVPLLIGAGARAFIPGGVVVISCSFCAVVTIGLPLAHKQDDAGAAERMPAGPNALDAGVVKAVDGNKKALALLSASLLALVPWMQISKAVSSDVSVSLSALGAVVASGVAIHIAFLAFNMTAVRVLGIGGKDRAASEGERRALVLVGSQKTLPIAVTVLGQLAAVLPGATGLAVIPCVVSHLSQILMDSFLVSWWLKQDAKNSPQARTA